MKNLERDNLNLRLCRHRHFQTGQITTLSERRWQKALPAFKLAHLAPYRCIRSGHNSVTASTQVGGLDAPIIRLSRHAASNDSPRCACISLPTSLRHRLSGPIRTRGARRSQVRIVDRGLQASSK